MEKRTQIKRKMTMRKVLAIILAILFMFGPMGHIPAEKVYAADSKVEAAINWAVGIANDNSHGYSQSIRWGPSYDCSSLVYAAFCYAGFDVPTGWGNTQTMVNHFTKVGFTWIPWSQIGGMGNLQRGDILLNNNSYNSNVQHTEIYLGGGQNVGAHSSKLAFANQISVSGYYDHPWLGVLRYGGGSYVPPTPNFTQDSKYNGVKGFKGYTLSTGNVYLYESNLSTTIGKIYPTDECTVHELYTNGWCKVTCPWNTGGTRTGYTKISDFIQSPTAALGSYTSTEYISLYSKPNLGTQIYRIYPNDQCVTVGSCGSATQVFMPMTGKGYYELGWAVLPDPGEIDTRYPVPFKCRILSDSNSVVCAYRVKGNASSYLGHVYVNDDCVVQRVYKDGWCQFTCPFYGKVETVYGKISDFSSCNINPYSLKAPKYAKTYYKSNKAAEVGWVDSGDDVTVIAVSGSMSQIIYPADVGKRCGWIDSSALVSSYTVSYNANGGSGAPASQTANKGTEITISGTVPVRTGYTFAGWGNSAEGQVLYASGSKYSANDNITLYAVWRKNEYMIKYDANGGEKAPEAREPEPQMQPYGEAVTAASSPFTGMQGIAVENGITQSGQLDSVTLERPFLSWNTKQDGTGTEVKAGQSYTPNADVTLYAQYGKASFTEDSLPDVPGRTGYTFDGWYDSRGYKNKIEAGQELDPDLGIIYAHWTQNSYTVSYDANGGSSAPETQTKMFGENLKLSEKKPEREGYTFKGWALTAGSREVAYESGSEYKENAGIILYAVWDADSQQDGLESITVESEPAKTTYEFGEELNTDGLVLKLQYNSGVTKTVTDGYTLSGYNSRLAEKQTVTVTYGGKTASFEVTVKEQPSNDIAVVSIGDIPKAVPGEQVEVDIQLTRNPGFSFMMLKLTYDKDVLELVEASNKTEGNNLFMLDDVIMWDSAADVAVGSTLQQTMGTVTFRIKPEIKLDDGAALCEIGIETVSCYNAKEEEVTVRANKGTIGVTTVIYGDVNDDGEIDGKDVQAVREYVITREVKDGFDVQRADTNGDGIIDGRDIIRLNQYLENPGKVKLGYDVDKVIGSSGSGGGEAFLEDVRLSLANISVGKDGMVSMDVILEENPGIAALNLSVGYGENYMELAGAENGSVIEGTVTQENNLLVWTTDTVSTGTGKLASLTFKLKDGVEPGNYPVSVFVDGCYDSAEKSHYGASDIRYVEVPMNSVAAETITLDQAALTLAGGDVAQLAADVAPLDATDKTVNWNSSDETVVTVSANGQICAWKKGTAVITAAVSNTPEIQASCTVTVSQDAPVLNIPLEEDPARKDGASGGQQTDKDKTDTDNTDTGKTDMGKVEKVTYRLSTETGQKKIAAGRKVKIKVTGSDGKTVNNRKLTWKSSNKKVAAVSQNGVVTLKKKSGGKTAVITATMKNKSSGTLKITIRSMKGAVKSIRITGKKAVKAGKSLQLKATVTKTGGTANKKLQWSSSRTKLAEVSQSGKVKTFKGKKGTVKITAKATDGTGRKKTVTIRIK